MLNYHTIQISVELISRESEGCWAWEAAGAGVGAKCYNCYGRRKLTNFGDLADDREQQQGRTALTVRLHERTQYADFGACLLPLLPAPLPTHQLSHLLPHLRLQKLALPRRLAGRAPPEPQNDQVPHSQGLPHLETGGRGRFLVPGGGRFHQVGEGRAADQGTPLSAGQEVPEGTQG